MIRKWRNWWNGASSSTDPRRVANRASISFLAHDLLD